MDRSVTSGQDTDIPTHPEEVKATFEMRFGNAIYTKSSARITPAGIIASGVATALILLAVAKILSVRR